MDFVADIAHRIEWQFTVPPKTGLASLLDGPKSVLGLRHLQKSAAGDGPSGISLGAAGFDPPALTPSAQPQRYAMHRA